MRKLAISTAGVLLLAAACSRSPVEPPPIIYDTDASGAPVATCESAALAEFFAKCGIPGLRIALPPIERAQFESFHTALRALARERSADGYGLAGMYFLYWGEQRAARALLSRARDLAPAEHRFWHYLGFNAALAEDDGEAERCYRRALELDRNYAATYLRLARVYTRSDRAREAEELLRAALELDPRSVYARSEIAALALARDDLPAAETLCKEALALDPRDRRVHGLLARLAKRRGDEAEERRHSALSAGGGVELTDPVPDPLIAKLRRDTNALAAVIQEAMVAYERGDLRRHAEFMREIARREPTAERRLQLAEALRLSGDRREAREIALALVAEQRERPQFHLALAKIELASGDPDAALAALAHAGTSDESDAWRARALATRGAMTSGSDDLRQAEAIARAVLARNPNLFEVRAVLAKTIFLDGRFRLPSARTAEEAGEVYAAFRAALAVVAAALEVRPLDPECTSLAKEIESEREKLAAHCREKGIALPQD